MVEQSTHETKYKGSSLAFAGTRWEKIAKKKVMFREYAYANHDDKKLMGNL